MTAQLPLIPGDVPVDPGVRVTARQRMALEYIFAKDTAVPDDELGALMHEERQSRGGNGHHRDVRCRFCGEEGAAMSQALEKKGLIEYVRNLGSKRPS